MSLAEEAYVLATRWDASRNTDIKSLDFKANDLDAFDSNQKGTLKLLLTKTKTQNAITAVFLERLQSYPALPPDHIAYLGDLYALSATSNAEIRFRFYELALLDPATPESKALASEASRWVVGEDGTGVIKGRMKFCRPVLRAANRADPETTKRLFIANKAAFHPIARKLIEKVSHSLYSIIELTQFIFIHLFLGPWICLKKFICIIARIV